MKYKLSDCVEIISGGTPKKAVSEYWDGNIPWITIKDFGSKYPKSTDNYITQEGLNHSAAKLSKDKDILISARGTVGEVMMVHSGYTFNQSIYGLRIKEKVAIPEYIYYWLLANKQIFIKNVHGSVFDTITRKIFDHIQIELPCIANQAEIVSKLNSIDSKIALNELINDNLSKLQQLNLSQLINRKLYKIVKIGDLEIIVSDHVANGSFKSLKDNVSYFDNPNYALFIRNIDFKKDLDGNKKYIDKKSYNYLKKSHLFGGEVVISNVADVGSVHRVPFIKKPMVVGNNQIFIKSKHFSMTDYLYVYFQSFWGQSSISSITSGSAQQKFNKTDFRSLEIPIPSEKWIQSNISPYVTLQDKIFNENQSLKQIKATLLNHCF